MIRFIHKLANKLLTLVKHFFPLLLLVFQSPEINMHGTSTVGTEAN